MSARSARARLAALEDAVVAERGEVGGDEAHELGGAASGGGDHVGGAAAEVPLEAEADLTEAAGALVEERDGGWVRGGGRGEEGGEVGGGGGGEARGGEAVAVAEEGALQAAYGCRGGVVQSAAGALSGRGESGAEGTGCCAAAAWRGGRKQHPSLRRCARLREPEKRSETRLACEVVVLEALFLRHVLPVRGPEAEVEGIDDEEVLHGELRVGGVDEVGFRVEGAELVEHDARVGEPLGLRLNGCGRGA